MMEKLASVRVEDGIAYVCVDVVGERVNTLSTPMTDRFEEIIDGLEREPGLEGVVLYSGKPDGFIAGFDIGELKRFGADPGGLAALVKRGHALMASFEDQARAAGGDAGRHPGRRRHAAPAAAHRAAAGARHDPDRQAAHGQEGPRGGARR
jgi:hypothetical protein